MDRLSVAAALREIALHLGLRGQNRFHAKAYARAAQTLELEPVDVAALVAADRLTELDGIGPSIAGQIASLVRDGRSPQLERLRREMPPPVLEMAQIKAIGRKRALQLWTELGIGSLPELEHACEAARVRTLSGVGPATEARIRQAIIDYRAQRGALRYPAALATAELLLARVRQDRDVIRAELAGELRRCLDVVSGIDIVVEAAAGGAPALIERAREWPLVARIERATPDGAELRLADGTPFGLAVAEPGQFARAWLRHSAAAGHVDALIARGLDRTSAETEAGIYDQLGLPYLPPEVRDGEGELEAALAGDDFSDLVRVEDIRGAIHCHTVYSDGKHTVEEMARAAEARGLGYITITDHSPTAHYAGGLSEERLRQQADEIAAVQRRVDIDILRGTESDIRRDGALDYSDAVLGDLDVVIASIHGRMRMDEDQMTARVVGALRQPVFKIWGHALGRLVLSRPPIPCRVDEALAAAAASRAAIEVNGDPYRLDLPPHWIRRARRLGIPFVVSTDAHSTRSLRYLEYGVAMARRGGLRRSEVLNTLDAAEFRTRVAPRVRPPRLR